MKDKNTERDKRLAATTMDQTFAPTPAPTYSPWGRVQDATQEAPGIWRVETASHGGLKLSAERNRTVPDDMRRKGGWYEEDCEWSLAVLAFPEEFKTLKEWQKEKGKSHYDYAVECAGRWYPQIAARFQS